MQELFGVSMTTITIVLVGLFVGIVAAVALLAWRSRVMLKLGLRNIPKRPSQTALIILGLMLSTVIIASAFGTGDTIVHTIRSLAAETLGNTDEVVSAGSQENLEESNYFDYARFDELRDGLSGFDKVDGLLPVIVESAPLINVEKQKNVPDVGVFAPDSQYYAGFTNMKNLDGQSVTLQDLAADEVYLDKDSAEELEANPGDRLYLFLGPEPVVLTLKDVVTDVSGGNFSALVMPLSRAQTLLGREGTINAIYVSNLGGPVDGARYSDEVKQRLDVLLADTGLSVDMVKKDVLENADLAGSVFTTIFVAFGLFSIAAGVLLIFLIFTLLAAARKSEMGMARAVGTKRHHLIQMFVFEGTAYDLCAALVGVALGVGVTYAMAGIMARTFRDTPLNLAYDFEPQSLVAAFCLGMLVTFVTVAFSSWRVSRLNIVRAIRDIPEPSMRRVSRAWLAGAVFLLFVGFVSSLGGIASKQGASLYIGISLFIIGLALLLRWLGVKQRLTFTLAGIGLLVWTLLPIDTLEVFGELQMGIEMFFLSGMMMVLGAVWIVSFNLDVLLRVLTAITSRLRGLVPALRTALAYPMSNRLRTGLTLAMFSLVIFTMIFMSAVVTASQRALENVESFSGGYDIQATVSYINPVPDMEAAIAAAPGLDPDNFEAIASASTLPLEVRQVDPAGDEWKRYPVHGVDDAYLETNKFEFSLVAEGYDAATVWQAVRDNPGLAVISGDAVPSRSQFGFGTGGPGFSIEGVYQEDESMQAVPLALRDLSGGKEAELTVVAVLEAFSFNYGVYTSRENLVPVWPSAAIATTYLFRLNEGVDATAVADNLDSAFVNNGMEATSIQELLDESSRTSFAINSLLQGFMSLGLVVGVAALGVISTRAVVERRHEIGVLRAIGYKRGTVQLSFLLESSLVALLGVLIGTVLGLALSYNVINFLKEDLAGLEFQVPWLQIAIIAAVACVASLLMTFLPARQASRIYPAEALRYE
jgi:putative ABC transport system permease protein